MAPKPSSGGSIGARLTRKAGPLPVLGWTVPVILGGYIGYRKLHGGRAA